MMYIGYLVLMLYAVLRYVICRVPPCYMPLFPIYYAVMFYVICRDMLCTMPWSLIYYAVKPPMRPKV